MFSVWTVVVGIVGSFIGFLLTKAWDWFEKRAEADTPENNKWELYTLLTYCDETGPVANRSLSIKRLNELCIASINSHRASNNYLPRLTLKQFKVDIVHNLSRAGLLEAVRRPSLYDKLLLLLSMDRYTLTDEGEKISENEGPKMLELCDAQLELLEYLNQNSGSSVREMYGNMDASQFPTIRKIRSQILYRLERGNLIERKLRFRGRVPYNLRSGVRYRLTRKGRDTSRVILEERKEFLDVKLNRRFPRNNKADERISRVDMHQRDRMRRQFWDIMNEKISHKEEDLYKLKWTQSEADESGTESDMAQQLMEDIRAAENQLELLRVERDGFASSYETCEDWVIKAYIDRKHDDAAARKDAEYINTPDEQVIHQLKAKRRGVSVVAHGFFEMTSDERPERPRPPFVVLKGSSALVEEVPSISDAYRRLRARLVDEGVLVREPGTNRYTFRNDYIFGSSSQASSVVLGRVSSGPREWREVSVEDTEREITYILKGRRSGVDVRAEGCFDESSDFIVLKGSSALVEEAPSISAVYRRLRKRLVDEEILVPESDTEKYTFSSDYAFSSASQASSVVLGRVSSGPREWREVSAEDISEDTGIIEDTEREITYILKGRRSGVDVRAEGCFDESSDFIVLKGSSALVEEAPSISAVYRRLRKRLVDEEILVPESDTEKYTFSSDYAFSSASQASSVVLGRVSSGPKEWRHTGNPSLRLGDAAP